MGSRQAIHIGAVLSAGAAAVVLVAGPAAGASVMAADGNVVVTNTETVQAYLDASGGLDVARVYEQVDFHGKGTVDLKNPVETQGLRNLDEFGGFDVLDGQMVGTYDIDGDMRLRSVSSFPGTLPLSVDVAYTLDGKEIEPWDVVGKSGLLEAKYTVRNVTGRPTEVAFDDGTGNTVTSTEEVVIPMVGSLSTVLPPNFTDVRSAEANMAGDGRGGTKMSFTMTLFGPIGKPAAAFGYTANISDSMIPKASISALPVSPLDSPSFKGGAASYQSGAITGVTLTAGATEIDSNLLKLRDGAGELLAGLIKLRDGAQELNAGLAGTAAPGAATLAAGADEAAAGAGELSTGVKKLDDGANQIADGTAEAGDGADALADGSAQVADGLLTATDQAPALIDGLGEVAGGLALLDAGLVKMQQTLSDPDTTQGVGKLRAGIKALIAGIGTKGNAATLLGGVEAIRSGLAGATATDGPIDDLKAGIDKAAGGASAIAAGLQNALAGVNAVSAGNTAALDAGGSIDDVEAAIRDIASVPACAADALCAGTVAATAAGVETQLRDSASASVSALGQVSGGLSGQAIPGLLAIADGLADEASPGVAQLKTQLVTAAGGLAKVECGLSNQSLPGICPGTPGLLEGLQQVDDGVGLLVNTVVSAIGDDNDTKADGTLRGGVHSIQEGVGQLSAGGAGLIDGLMQLSYGANLVAEGNSELSAGLGLLSTGAGQLADGTGQASDGAAQLADGNGQIANGANRLTDGLGEAADGSGQLADGLGTAAEGAPALEDGAQRLSDEGTKKLIEAGKATAADYGAKYALIEAGAARAQDEGMAYGAPQGAAGATAYSYELASAEGRAGQNIGRGLGAAAAFGLATGAALLLRRRVV